MNSLEEFDELYRMHAAAIYRACMRAVSRREIAEELMSEVFLALHQSWHKIDRDQLPAWFFTVAKRRAADYWRRHYVEDKWAAEYNEEATWQEPEFNLELLLSRCTALKPVHRICVTLRFAQGMSRTEIAEHTNLTELRVKDHLQYALQLLRDQMVPESKSGNTQEFAS